MCCVFEITNNMRRTITNMQKAGKRVQISIEAMSAILLLVVLAALTMLLISSTGRSYKNILNKGDTAQDIRTGLFFISTKVRQADNGGNISVVKAPWGGNAIVISQKDGGSSNEDWIFYYDGGLRETLISKGTAINPPACQIISSLSSFSVTQNMNELNITVTKSSKDSASKSQAASENLVLTLRT